ncbi:MAG: D-amino acid aminotransferase, partial [Rubrivivax sp.]
MNLSPPDPRPSLPTSLCYLNGEFQPLRDARISVLDRGFIFGDGVYEVLPAYDGKVFRFDQHMARLDRSLGELRIPNPLTREEWLGVARRLIEDLRATTASVHQLIYIQVTRGVAVRDHVMPPGLQPTVLVTGGEMKLASPAQREQGVVC